MYSAILATALFAAAPSLVQAARGSAIVVNGCKYPVYLTNVPAADGGFTEIDQILQPKDIYTQAYTELTNAQGWSIKLSKTKDLVNIMQYEYCYHNDGTIWYDISDVDGNPWNANWELTASSLNNACQPKQQSYRYSTDDAYGMQSCADDATITVTLCSGESQNDPSGSADTPAASSSQQEQVQEPASTSSTNAPVPYTTPTTTAVQEPATTASAASSQYSFHAGGKFAQEEGSGHVFVEDQEADNVARTTELVIVTVYATETATAHARRHVHHHNRRHAHL